MSNTQLLEKRKNYTIFESALACVIFIVLTLLFSICYSSLPVEIRANKPVYYIAQFLIEAMFGVAAWVVATTRKIDLLEASGFKKKISGKMVGLGFLIALVSIVMFGSLTNYFLAILEILGYTPRSAGIEINNFGVYLVYVITTCIAPALFEEMLFRGTIASGFKSFGKKTAIICSALIFMLMHGSPDQTIHQFIVGLILGYLFISSGNIWLGVIVHFFNNFISITDVYILTALSTGEDSDATVVETNGFMIVIGVIIAILLAVGGYYIIKKLLDEILNEDARVNGSVQNSVPLQIADSNGQANPDLNQNTVLENKTENLQADLQSVTSLANEEDRFKIDSKEFEISKEEFEDSKDSEAKTDSEVLAQNTEVGATAPAGENGEVNQKTDGGEKKISMSTMILFVLSGGYLVFEWLIALISGFMG